MSQGSVDGYSQVETEGVVFVAKLTSCYRESSKSAVIELNKVSKFAAQNRGLLPDPFPREKQGWWGRVRSWSTMHWPLLQTEGVIAAAKLTDVYREPRKTTYEQSVIKYIQKHLKFCSAKQIV